MKIKRISTGVMILAMLVALGITAPRNATAAGDATPAIVAQFAAAWNSHDLDKLLSPFTDDVYYEDVAFGEVSHGKAELRKFAASEYEGVPDLELKITGAAIHDGHGTIEWTFSGTDKAVFKTGKKFSVRGVSVIDVRNGKISRSLDFYDSATIMRQVGMLPAQ